MNWRKHASPPKLPKLIVVAPPAALGEMRKHYHKEVQSRLVGEIAKDLANHPVPEIEKIIAQS
jgi:protein required for attachment to host cells